MAKPQRECGTVTQRDARKVGESGRAKGAREAAAGGEVTSQLSGTTYITGGEVRLLSVA